MDKQFEWCLRVVISRKVFPGPSRSGCIIPKCFSRAIPFGLHYPEISFRGHPKSGYIIPKCLSWAIPFGLYYPETPLQGHPIRVVLSRNVSPGPSLVGLYYPENRLPRIPENLSIGVNYIKSLCFTVNNMLSSFWSIIFDYIWDIRTYVLRVIFIQFSS